MYNHNKVLTLVINSMTKATVKVQVLGIIELPRKGEMKHINEIKGKVIDFKRNRCADIIILPKDNFRCEPFSWVSLTSKDTGCLEERIIDILKRIVRGAFLFIMRMPNEETLRKSITKIYKKETSEFLDRIISEGYSIEMDNIFSFFTRKFYETVTRLPGRRLMFVSLIRYRSKNIDSIFIIVGFSRIIERGIILQALEGSVSLRELENILDIVIPPEEEKEKGVRLPKIIVYPAISSESEISIEKGFVKIYDESESIGTYKFIDAIIPLVEKFMEFLTKNMVTVKEQQRIYSVSLLIVYATLLEAILNKMIREKKEILKPEEFAYIVDDTLKSIINNKFKPGSTEFLEKLVADIKSFVTSEKIYIAQENLSKMLSRNIEIQIGDTLFMIPLRNISLISDYVKLALYTRRRENVQYVAIIFKVEQMENVNLQVVEDSLSLALSRIKVSKKKVPILTNERISFDILRYDRARSLLEELCKQAHIC